MLLFKHITANILSPYHVTAKHWAHPHQGLHLVLIPSLLALATNVLAPQFDHAFLVQSIISTTTATYTLLPTHDITLALPSPLHCICAYQGPQSWLGPMNTSASISSMYLNMPTLSMFTIISWCPIFTYGIWSKVCSLGIQCTTKSKLLNLISNDFERIIWGLQEPTDEHYKVHPWSQIGS